MNSIIIIDNNKNKNNNQYYYFTNYRGLLQTRCDRHLSIGAHKTEDLIVYYMHLYAIVTGLTEACLHCGSKHAEQAQHLPKCRASDSVKFSRDVRKPLIYTSYRSHNLGTP